MHEFIVPRYRKLANLYAGQDRFVEMEFETHRESDLVNELGVTQLPFFAVWRAGELVSAEAIGFSRRTQLSERISAAVND